MKHYITELCLSQDDGITPFAVLVEHEKKCSWSLPSQLHGTKQEWLAYLLKGNQRISEEWWVLEVWRDWLNEVANMDPESRRNTLERLEKTTPGCVVRKPRLVDTRLPAGAVATRWCRDRLFDRAEVIAAQIAANLATNGLAHWQSALMVGDHLPLEGDWIVEVRPAPGTGSSASGLAMIKTIEYEEIPSVTSRWEHAQSALQERYPYGVAVVRDWHGAKVMDSGCLVGGRFAAPVLTAVAAVRAKWGGSTFTQSEEEEHPSAE